VLAYMYHIECKINVTMIVSVPPMKGRWYHTFNITNPGILSPAR
jgi:hypothetical protein